MAFPLPRGLTPPEIAFVAEMEQVTVVPRQRLEGLELLSVSSLRVALLRGVILFVLYGYGCVGEVPCSAPG